MSLTEGVCRGCGNRRGTTHCKFPSNPAVDAQVQRKNQPKSDLPLCVERRKKANAISLDNMRRSI